MREIKFRGKRIDNGEWVIGYFVVNPDEKYYITEPSAMFFIEVLPESVGEWTGLLDKDGKEIFEGDVVEYKFLEGFECGYEDYTFSEEARSIRRSVSFVGGQFAPREYYNECEDGFYSYRTFDFEVIGNLTDTPSLLERKEQ